MNFIIDPKLNNIAQYLKSDFKLNSTENVYQQARLTYFKLS